MILDHNPLLESGAATCSSDRRSAATPIHASTNAPKTMSTATSRYPVNNAVLDPVPMIHPNSTDAPTPPTSVPIAYTFDIASARISHGTIPPPLSPGGQPPTGR